MGRPLNKKFFGNRNVGTAISTDNKIGGEGIASISTATVGSFVVNNTRQNFPLLNIDAPTIPNGVQATADVVFELDTVTYASGGATGYSTGISTDIVGLGGGAIVNITVNGGGAVTAVELGVGSNRGEFRRGDFTGSGITTFNVVQGVSGTDVQMTCTFRLKSITIVEKGSGYVAAPTLSWSGHTFTGQTPPSGQTVTLTTDTGAVGSSTNQENAIIAYAWVGNGGGSRQQVDIVKQESSRRYSVRTASVVSGEPWTVRSAILVAKTGGAAADTDGNNTFNEMDITAYDAAGKEYWVLKLTAHKALIKRKSTNTDGEFADPTVYPNGQNVAWTLNDTSGTKVYTVQPYLAAGVNVKIDNA